VDLDPGTVAVLRAWRKRQAEDRLALGGAWPAHGLVFTMEDGQAPHPDTFSKVFDRLARTAPVSRITFHGLRHTHATLLLKAGEPVNAVAARLGHQDATVTLKYYAHVIPGQGVSTAQRFAGVMAL
jgi:integrase